MKHEVQELDWHEGQVLDEDEWLQQEVWLGLHQHIHQHQQLHHHMLRRRLEQQLQVKQVQMEEVSTEQIQEQLTQLLQLCYSSSSSCLIKQLQLLLLQSMQLHQLMLQL